MKSGYKVVWTEEANKNLNEIIAYLECNWTDREIRKFVTKLEKIIILISSRPELFGLTHKRKKVRKCVLSMQTSIYYRIDKDEIFIVALFDNRQDPKKLKL